MNRLFWSVAMPLLMFSALLVHAPQVRADEPCPINRHIQYNNKDALRQLQKTVIPAVYDDDNIIALHILRQTMYALGQDMALEVAPQPDRTALRSRQEKLWLKTVQQMAADGDPFFMVVLAIINDYGCGVPMNKNNANALRRKASDKGFGPASFSLAKAYQSMSQNHDTAHQDFREVVALYHKAGDWGVPGAWYNLGCLYNTEKLGKKQLNVAMSYWEKSAVMGHAWSQYNLGLYYTQGGPDVPENKTLGEKWLREAANNGHGRALYTLSKLFQVGAKVGDTFFMINLE